MLGSASWLILYVQKGYENFVKERDGKLIGGNARLDKTRGEVRARVFAEPGGTGGVFPRRVGSPVGGGAGRRFDRDVGSV